ncbi:MAG TPA: hypothetical protein VGJ45_22705 [Pseudonocardiaceae bacterium]
MTEPAQPPATSGGYRFTPAEIQQQLIQCTDLLAKFENSYLQRAGRITTAATAPDVAGSVPQADAVRRLGGRATQRAHNQADFLRAWYDTLISARARYLEQEHLTEAQWNVLAQDRQPE